MGIKDTVTKSWVSNGTVTSHGKGIWDRLASDENTSGSTVPLTVSNDPSEQAEGAVAKFSWRAQVQFGRCNMGKAKIVLCRG